MSLADRTIEALRATHDRLATRVGQLSDDELSRPSAAADWTVAQVLSHLGSSAEINLITLRTAPAKDDRPADANQSIWDRWDAMSPRDQAEGFVQASEELVSAYESLDSTQRASLDIPLAFLPEPADVALAAGLRLNEVALHAWDVDAAFDDGAAIPEQVAAVLAEQYRGPIAFLLKFTAKPEVLEGRAAAISVASTAPVMTLGLLLGQPVTIGDVPDQPDGQLRLPLEALLRLIGGRLPEKHTPAGVDITGSLSLADLRAVFPGY